MFPGFSPTKRKKDVLATVERWLMVLKTVPHPLTSQDLTPCDFWLFLRLKKNLSSSRFDDREKMKEAVPRVLDTFSLNEFHSTHTKYLECYNECIEVRTSYIELERLT